MVKWNNSKIGAKPIRKKWYTMEEGETECLWGSIHRDVQLSLLDRAQTVSK